MDASHRSSLLSGRHGRPTHVPRPSLTRAARQAVVAGLVARFGPAAVDRKWSRIIRALDAITRAGRAPLFCSTCRRLVSGPTDHGECCRPATAQNEILEERRAG